MALMELTDLPQRLRSALDGDPAPRRPAGTRLAGVLLPLVERPEPSLIFTRRAEDLSRHAGEISFPGGLRHDEDRSLVETALRETEEELGIAPSSVEVLGALPSVHTFVSAILIVPFVGVIDGSPALSPNAAEIAEVLEYSLDRLASAEDTVEYSRGDHVYRGFAYEMGANTIWGATARILHDLLDVLRRVPT
jgi:8-oxo-dGTP pyrophosphatase MutT (NUDIX family)